jgi:hypothetical protein
MFARNYPVIDVPLILIIVFHHNLGEGILEMKSGDEFVAKVKEFKEHDKNVDGLWVEVCLIHYPILFKCFLFTYVEAICFKQRDL